MTGIVNSETHLTEKGVSVFPPPSSLKLFGMVTSKIKVRKKRKKNLGGLGVFILFVTSTRFWLVQHGDFLCDDGDNPVNDAVDDADKEFF